MAADEWRRRHCGAGVDVRQKVECSLGGWPDLQAQVEQAVRLGQPVRIPATDQLDADVGPGREVVHRGHDQAGGEVGVAARLVEDRGKGLAAHGARVPEIGQAGADHGSACGTRTSRWSVFV